MPPIRIQLPTSAVLPPLKMQSSVTESLSENNNPHQQSDLLSGYNPLTSAVLTPNRIQSPTSSVLPPTRIQFTLTSAVLPPIRIQSTHISSPTVLQDAIARISNSTASRIQFGISLHLELANDWLWLQRQETYEEVKGETWSRHSSGG
jgi:hypothetical protein